MGIIEVHNLTKDYGSGRGIFDVSLEVNKGEVFGFLGPNGAGKSTTIRHLLGFSKPDSGTASILGNDCFKNYDKALLKVGYIPGEIALLQGLNGNEFLKMMMDMKQVKDDSYLKEMLDLFKLTTKDLETETKRMSLGTKRKLAIVCAFLNNPDVLILDEPTSGLDPVMQEIFVDLIKREKEKGKTILLSSHIFSEIDSTCDRISIIKDGKIVSEFLANDLKHSKTKYYLVRLDKTEFEKFITEIKDNKYIDLLDYQKKNKEVLLSCLDDNTNELVSILSNYKVKDFESKIETLEDYFMRFYKEDKDFRGAL